MSTSPQAAPTRSEARPGFARRQPLLLTGLTTLGALIFTSVVLLASDVPPLEAYQLIFLGTFSSPTRISDMVMLSAPLLLCSAGLTLTFAAGLYNLGIEGQMVLGAVVAMVPLRLLPDLPPPLLWMLTFACGALGGAAWALLAAWLRIGLRVNEIFAGLGLNFLASGIALYLVLGPWRRVGQASSSGTQPLPNEIWLPTLDKLRLAPVAPIIALLALATIWFAVTRTRWGLELRAVGLNPQAARRMGVPATRRLAESLAFCGAMAGLAGAIQILGVFHQLIPSVSSGIGLLGLLVVLLVRANPAWVLPIALIFAVFTVGSVQIPLKLGADSSIAGVLQGALVLFALLGRGLSARK
ncbi:MAG: ABC transporter permease [Oscillochloris sp.]|nr:ABC transporter permease [Oscillochloris sp.]